MNDFATACHEAAHSVITYRVSGHAESVSIIPHDDGTLGRATGDVSDSFIPSDMEGRILSLLAGGHAQREVDPECGADGCDGDNTEIERLVREWGWEGRRREFEDRSLALVREHWTEVTAVAKELVYHRSMDETEVELLADGEDVEQYRALRKAAFPYR